MLTFGFNRVKLNKIYKKNTTAENSEFGDYINASWIDSGLSNKLLIAASAPLKATVCDFLQMIMEHNVKLVIKLCEDKLPSGKEQSFRYIPSFKEDKTTIFERVSGS